MGIDDVHGGVSVRGERAVAVLQAVVRVAVGVAVVGGAAGLLAWWADPTCATGGGHRGAVTTPGGVGYVAMAVGLLAGAALLVAGLASAPRGSWWRTLALLPVGLVVTGGWVFVAALACWS